MLRYSSSFVQVKSQCQPDPQREKVGWRFTACICIWPRYLIILHLLVIKSGMDTVAYCGFAPIFPDTCYHLTHYWPAAADIPVASDNPAHYADAIRY
ncbi:hypothetical protein, partial [Klebsiella quasipneumoniae]|uniref:hypothetical protein n=1 Tax=Klebsiella quasipneumoniae TaxID=1463165 RepID=UPI001C47669A